MPFPWWTSQSRIATRPSAELGLRPAGGDRDRVEEAEAHRPRRARRDGRAAARARSRRGAPPRSRRPAASSAASKRRLGADRVGVEPAAASRARARGAPGCGSAGRPPRSPARTRRTGSARAAPRSVPATRDGRRSDAGARTPAWLTTLHRLRACSRDPPREPVQPELARVRLGARPVRRRRREAAAAGAAASIVAIRR